jgi:hypothetical protein
VGERRFPIVVTYLTYVSAILLVILYLGRLIVLDPTSPVILLPALLNGFLINPPSTSWWVWPSCRGVRLSPEPLRVPSARPAAPATTAPRTAPR